MCQLIHTVSKWTGPLGYLFGINDVLELSFAPNPRWSEYYAPGWEIRQYYERTVKEYGIDQHLHLKHEILSAIWSDEIHQWVVTVKNLTTGETFTETAHFFVSAAGRLNVPKLPAIPGLETEFKGTVFHSSQWSDDRDVEGKRVAIIGNGASGVQLLTNTYDKWSHIDHYSRSKHWIVPAFSPHIIAATSEVRGGKVFTEEEKEIFVKDPKAYLEFRRSIDKHFHSRFRSSIIGSEESEKTRQKAIDQLHEWLGGDEEWLERLVPDFAPGCSRPTVSAGYIEAIRSPKVDYIKTKISHASVNGLVTEDGEERKVDVIIAATGFKNGFLPLFPTVGKDGHDLSKHWADDGPIGYPETYFGVMAPKMPNYFGVIQVSSPHSIIIYYEDTNTNNTRG